MFLLHHDITVATLASGSRGNCTYVGDGQHGVLIDCGISTAQILRRMKAIGLGDAPIDAVLITHEHSDHVGAARVLCNKLHKRTGKRTPFFMTMGTHMALRENTMPKRVTHVKGGTEFMVGGLRVQPISIPHDTHEPVAFTVAKQSVNVGVLTDFGYPTRLIARQLANLDVAVLEFNHDLEMLMDGDYPWRLKERIRGKHGHISNTQAADLISRAATSKLKHLVLAHLSEHNNTPEKAEEMAHWALAQAGLRDVTVHTGQQDVPLEPVCIEVPAQQAKAPSRKRSSAADRPHLQLVGPEQMGLFG